MANPLVYKGNGVIQVMSTSELSNLAQVVLEYMASNDGPGGIYTSNTGNAGFSLIGTFTDTQYQGAIGSGDITVISTNYNLYQDLQTPTGTDAPKPLVWNSNSAPLQAMTDVQANTLADFILNYCVTNEGPHSYTLSNSSPNDGGTWVSLGQISDVFSGATQSNVYLYKKLNMGIAKTLYRPIKASNDGSIQRFSDLELNQIAKRVRQRIVATGVGQYLFQESTPVIGTWVSKGTIVDTLPTTSSQEYGSISYDSTYTGTTGAVYTSTQDVQYSDSGLGGGYYTADIAYTTTTTSEFIGVSTSYTGLSPIDYTGILPTEYTTTTSPTYSAAFLGTTYTSSGSFTFLGTGFTSFSSTVATTYTGSGFSAFSGTTPVAFSTTTPTTYTGPVAPVTFSGFGPTVYTAATYTSIVFYYYYMQYYAGPTSGTYTGPTSSYVGANSVQFGSLAETVYTKGYLGGIAYDMVFGGAPYTGTGPVLYTASKPTYFTGFVPGILYTGVAPATYTGPGTGYFSGFGPGPTYSGAVFYTGVRPTYFTASFSSSYTGTASPTYTGTVTSTFAGTTFTSFTSSAYTSFVDNLYTGASTFSGIGTNYYTGTETALYDGIVDTVYTTSYTSSYTGSLINNASQTITSKTLWRRIA